eukprot:2276866-Rhodomonas_salina.1
MTGECDVSVSETSFSTKSGNEFPGSGAPSIARVRESQDRGEKDSKGKMWMAKSGVERTPSLKSGLRLMPCASVMICASVR